MGVLGLQVPFFTHMLTRSSMKKMEPHASQSSVLGGSVGSFQYVSSISQIPGILQESGCSNVQLFHTMNVYGLQVRCNWVIDEHDERCSS